MPGPRREWRRLLDGLVATLERELLGDVLDGLGLIGSIAPGPPQALFDGDLGATLADGSDLRGFGIVRRDVVWKTPTA